MDFQEKLLNFDFVPKLEPKILVLWGRAVVRAKWLFPHDLLRYSYGSRGGSNKLSHAQIL